MEKKKFIEKVEIPEGVNVSIEEDIIKVNGPKGSLERKLLCPQLKITKQDSKIILESGEKPNKTDKRMIGTYKSHIKNLLIGVTVGFTYKLKICSGHFPMNVAIEGKVIIIKNFLGEKIPRKAKIIENVNVEINGDEIIITSPDKEAAGQVSSNLEFATKIRGRDRRVFQDGIFLVNKAGKVVR